MAIPDHPTIPLIDAAKAASLSQVQANLYWCRREGGCNVNARDELERTALHHAAFSGHQEIVSLLLDAVADVNAVEKNGWTPLFMGVIGRADVELARLLLARGAFTTLRDTSGATLLHWADGDLVQVLIEKGAPVNARNEDGETALFRLAQYGDVVAVTALITARANVNEQSKYGKLTPLFIAAANGRVDVVRLLMKAGANVNAEVDNGQRPLHQAALAGHHHVAAALIEGGADVNAQDNTGSTPLHYAASEGRLDVVSELLESKAKVNVRNRKQETPLGVAEQKRHQTISALLQVSGGKK